MFKGHWEKHILDVQNWTLIDRGACILTQCNLTHVFWPTYPSVIRPMYFDPLALVWRQLKDLVQGVHGTKLDEGTYKSVWLSEVELSTSQVSYFDPPIPV